MSDARRREDQLHDLAELHGVRLVPLPRPWFRSPRGRIRAAAWIALGALFVMLCPAVLLFSVSETAGLTVALSFAGVLLLALAAIFVEVFVIGSPDADEDDDERAVARMVSGKGVRPPR